MRHDRDAPTLYSDPANLFHGELYEEHDRVWSCILATGVELTSEDTVGGAVAVRCS